MNPMIFKIAIVQLVSVVLWLIALGLAYAYKLKQDRWYVPNDNERMDRERNPIPYLYWAFMLAGTIAAALWAGFLLNYVGNSVFLAG